MSSYGNRRARRVRYTRVCQHCEQAIQTVGSYSNFYYNVLCRSCFLDNAVPQQEITGPITLFALVSGPVDGANLM